MNNAICQKWEESERGWGIRPDGYSLHLNEEDRKQYIEDYWDRMPDEVPDEYERPSGEPYITTVDDETLEEIKNSKSGIRRYRHNYPEYPPGGEHTGWVNMR